MKHVRIGYQPTERTTTARNASRSREWSIGRARTAKVRRLIDAIERYCAGQGPHDAIAMAMVARRLTDESWGIVERIAGEKKPSSPITRQLVLDELESRAQEVRP